MLLTGKTILITGATRGIGKAMAELFAREGGRIFLTGRDEKALSEVHSLLTPHPDGHIWHSLNVRDPLDVKLVFEELTQKNKIALDVLVNNAGIMRDAMLQTSKPEMIQETYETNVFGMMYCAQQAIKSFIRKRSGSIINLTSIIGAKGAAGNTVYGSSKAAVIGFTTSLAKELAPLNIRVNALAPGFIATEMTQHLDPKVQEKTLASIGMRRVGTPEDVAKSALFLASDLSVYVTGQVIGVDGGMVI